MEVKRFIEFLKDKGDKKIIFRKYNPEMYRILKWCEFDVDGKMVKIPALVFLLNKDYTDDEDYVSCKNIEEAINVSQEYKYTITNSAIDLSIEENLIETDKYVILDTIKI